jgi:hypothetical protein
MTTMENMKALSVMFAEPFIYKIQCSTEGWDLLKNHPRIACRTSESSFSGVPVVLDEDCPRDEIRMVSRSRRPDGSWESKIASIINIGRPEVA